MTTRSLTEVFILMRNNAVQSRHFYSEQKVSDRMSLVGQDAECGYELKCNGDSRIPPLWVDGLEEAQYSLMRLRSKISELDALHAQHLHRPTLDDSSEEEKHIELLTQEIGRMFSAIHRLIQQIREQREGNGNLGKQLTQNVVTSLVARLQELSLLFRTSQNSYLNKLQSREERSRQYFPTSFERDLLLQTNSDTDEESNNIDLQFGTRLSGPNHLEQQQLLMLEEENTQMIKKREQEVRQIVKSIADLNHIFKDLSHMVVDQGTILDRIDYNIEQCHTQVQKAYTQLKKADSYQKKSRKMMCILCLSFATLFLIILYIIVKL